MQELEGPAQVVAPDVATVDHPGREHGAVAEAVGERSELTGVADEVDVEAGDGQTGGQVEVVPEAAEVGGEQKVELRAAGQDTVGVGDRSPVALVEIGPEAGLVELDPRRAGPGQGEERLGVDGEERRKELERWRSRRRWPCPSSGR